MAEIENQKVHLDPKEIDALTYEQHVVNMTELTGKEPNMTREQFEEMRSTMRALNGKSYGDLAAQVAEQVSPADLNRVVDLVHETFGIDGSNIVDVVDARRGVPEDLKDIERKLV